MSKYVIDSETLEGLGDAVRSVTGITRRLTPEEMIAEVKDILNATTFILVDKDGNEYPAAYIDSDVVLTATPNDIRKGATAITSEGVIEGVKEIPAYHTTEGHWLIPIGSSFAFKLRDGRYAYSKLQALICQFNGSMRTSVATDRIVINDNVYAVNSTDVIAEVTTDPDTESIVFGLTNTSEKPYVIHYFTYKEEY